MKLQTNGVFVYLYQLFHKMNRTLKILIVIALLSCTSTKNTTDNTSEPKKIPNPEKVEDLTQIEDLNVVLENKTYQKSIKTILVHRKGWELSNSAMQLNSNEVLQFSFDELGSNLGDYYYTVIHCTHDWKKSDIIESNYLEGFFQDYISTYKFSFNTVQPYVHYEVEIPNKNLKITQSGNYIFKVYKNNNQNEVVFTQRFKVYENIIATKAKVNRPTLLVERNYKQEIDFELDITKLNVLNLQEDLHVVIQQNNRWDNEITNLTPLYIKGNELIYDYNNKENMFDGGNEFRFLDIKTLRYRGQKVKQIVTEKTSTDVYMLTELKRTYKNYNFYDDLNGNFIIRNQNGVNHVIESDYATVHFALSFDEKVDGEVYVFGRISNYQFKEEFKMSYNSRTKQYTLPVLLKQGYYDYHYVVKQKNKPAKIPFMEGDHFETNNDYGITTYYKDPTCDCDRIVGYHTFKSKK